MKRWLFSTAALCACGPATPLEVTVPMQSAAQVDAAQSYELWVIDEVDRQGTTVDCDDLIARRVLPKSPNLAVVSGPNRGTFGGPIALQGLSVGTRVFLIELFDGPEQTGVRVGAGCKAGVVIAPGQHVQLELQARAPAPIVGR